MRPWGLLDDVALPPACLVVAKRFGGNLDEALWSERPVLIEPTQNHISNLFQSGFGEKKKELTGATDLAGILSCRIAGGTKGVGLDLLVGSLCVFATLAEDAYVANGTIVAALTDGVGYFFVVGAGGGFFGGHAAHYGGGG